MRVGCSPVIFNPILQALLDFGDYMLLADLRAYIDAQDRVDAAYSEPEGCVSFTSVTGLPALPHVSRP
jgi:Carbohydrate phosphorylase